MRREEPHCVVRMDIHDVTLFGLGLGLGACFGLSLTTLFNDEFHNVTFYQDL